MNDEINYNSQRTQSKIYAEIRGNAVQHCSISPKTDSSFPLPQKPYLAFPAGEQLYSEWKTTAFRPLTATATCESGGIGFPQFPHTAEPSGRYSVSYSINGPVIF
jgi:hypothetical protein